MSYDLHMNVKATLVLAFVLLLTKQRAGLQDLKNWLSAGVWSLAFWLSGMTKLDSSVSQKHPLSHLNQVIPPPPHRR